jgi:hypothetical protein
MKTITIGIYGISSQSGRAFLADYVNKGYNVIGYTRPTEHGNQVLDAIHKLNGLYLERPDNSNHEPSKFVPLGESCVTANLELMVSKADIIIIPLPSTAHVSAVTEMNNVGLWKRRVPIVLAPSRSVASPYLWDILGERYPIICFSTCPYSCKAPKPEVSLIKRRKRTYTASLEGDINRDHFHCATYMLNIDEIERRRDAGEIFSFYMDGIYARPEVGAVLEQIDQVRLQIADALGIKTFGLKSHPREDIWRKLTNGLRALEEESADDIEILRRIRKEFTEYLDNCVISAQHWLDITYGVERKEGESLSESIGRTPTYQKNSVPQLRYVTEDIPTGLVPFEALAKMLGINCDVVTRIIDMYNARFTADARAVGRNLQAFDKDYIVAYLKGRKS